MDALPRFPVDDLEGGTQTFVPLGDALEGHPQEIRIGGDDGRRCDAQPRQSGDVVGAGAAGQAIEEPNGALTVRERLEIAG
jgi:hypothetical protein